MINVCLVSPPIREMDLSCYHIESFDPSVYLDSTSCFSLTDLVAGGLDRYMKRRALIRAEGIDRLYRDRDPAYMRMVRAFLDKFQNYDIVVMGNYNFIHPDILFHELKKPIKILCFSDDPHSSYIRGIPYLWAFDGAYYISPSYSDDSFLHEALSRWGCDQTYWWPLTQPCDLPVRDEAFFRNRSQPLVYVGNPTLTKIDRLIHLKNHFGKQLQIHGRWRARGYFGLLRGLVGKPIYWQRVTPISPEARAHLYYQTKIGFNMHVSERPTETGNMRMYETPSHGMLQVCDKAARDAHESIFTPNQEAVYYDDIPDAIDKIEYYLTHEDERVEIARAGYERVRRDYNYKNCLLAFLNWAVELRKSK